MRSVFILPPAVHLLDITGPAHIFYEAACYHAPVELIFGSMSVQVTEVDSSCALSFAKLVPFDRLELKSGDLVFVPGLDSSLLLDEVFMRSSRDFQKWLAVQHRKGVTVCSVCTGAFLLAEAGLLDHRECTTHWKYTEQFKRRYPLAKFQANRLFVKDHKIYTSAGVSSGIDLALYLVEEIWGSNFVAQIAKEVVIYFRRTPEDPQLNVFTQYRNHLESRIHNVQDRLAHSIETRLNIKDLADDISMSPRNLTRLFKKTTGITIGAYLDRLRSVRAKQVLSEGHTMQAAAAQCGLKSTNQLRSLLKKQPDQIAGKK